MEKRHKFQIKSIYSRLLLFNIILIVIATVLPEAVMSEYFERRYKEKLEEINYENIKKVRDFTDETVFEQLIGAYVANFSDQPSNDILIAPTYKNVREDAYTLLQISRKLEAIKEAYPFINRVDVYYLYNDLLFCGENVFFLDNGSLENRIQKQWMKDLLTSDKELAWQPISDAESACAYMRSISYYSSEYKTNVIIEINKKALQDAMADAKSTQGDMYGLLSEEGRIICDVRMEKRNFVPEQEWLRELGRMPGDGFFTFKNGSTEYIVSYAGSGYNDWKYFSVVPVDDVFSGIGEIQVWIFIFCVFFVCLNIVFAVVMTKRAHAPMEYIIRNISAYMKGDGSEEEKNQYQLIEKTFRSLQFQVESLRGNLEENRPLIYNNMIRRILNSKDQHIYRDSEILKFRKKYFSSFIAIIYHEKDADIRSRIMINYHVNDLLHQYKTWYDIYSITDENELIYGILNFDKEDLQAVGKDLEQHLKQILKVPFTLCYGNMIDDENNISVSYKEAKITKEYAFFYPKNQMLYYSELKDLEKAGINLSGNAEERIERAGKVIKAGDWAQLRKITDEMIALVMSNESTAGYRMNTLTDFVFSIRKGAIGSGYDVGALFGEDIREQFKRIDHISDAREWFEWIISQLEAASLRKQESCSIDLKTQIEEYVAANVFNELSLSRMSEDLCISSSYLSRIFKSVMGINCSEYLVNVKLEKARELLSTTNCTVKEISEKLGYASLSHFNRIFKEHFGCTPKQYKKS